MNYIEEEGEQEDETKQKKKTVLALLVVAVLLLVIILIVMFVVKGMVPKALSLYVNGTEVKKIPNGLFRFDESGSIAYISLQDVANLIDYEYQKGEYGSFANDSKRCYLESKYQITGFSMASNEIYKISKKIIEIEQTAETPVTIRNTQTGKDEIILERTNATANNVQTREYYEIDENVKLFEDKLYISPDGLMKACNLSLYYNKENNQIVIYTLQYLAASYSKTVAEYGLTISQDYENQKVILDNMLVVKKQDKYGVVSLKDKTYNTFIIGTKCDSIIYNEITDEFIVTSGEYKGIIKSNGDQKIGVNYQDIRLADDNLGLYCVKKDDLYGIIDFTGKIRIHIEYHEIGVSSSFYKEEHLSNPILFYNTCIPLMKNGKWGLLDINGNVLQPETYDSLGYVNTSKEKAVNNTILIPELEGIIVCRNGKYGIIGKDGEVILPVEMEAIYSITTGTEEIFYVDYQGYEKIRLSDVPLQSF